MKTTIGITIDVDVAKAAKEKIDNISQFVEDKLREKLQLTKKEKD